MYNQLIETTTDIDMAPRYPQSTPPPQTSPLPLNCPKKQSKSVSPSNPKRSKCSESYSSGYNCLKPVTKTDSDTPKPIDYKSCDFTTTQTRDVKPVVGDNEEAKDYSKSGTNMWKCGNLINMAASTATQATTEIAGGTSGADQSSAEQGM